MFKYVAVAASYLVLSPFGSSSVNDTPNFCVLSRHDLASKEFWLLVLLNKILKPVPMWIVPPQFYTCIEIIQSLTEGEK